ncbi:MAG TPA: murein biosynthesis integral membrane protein MurJ [Streptosporangiaceae bacterium]|nr:murein biosynthesis integral membrane protein MurJ [Streptosporangiaceae bacterium]
MTTGVPEPDSYPDSGGQGWDVRPAVPGWSAGQDYTGPLFDDTGWHIDLSDVDWDADAPPDRADGGNRTSRFEDEDRQYRNAAGPATVGYDRAAEAPPGWADRRAGRRARHARPDDETRAGPDFRPPSAQPPGMRRRAAGQPPPRTQPRRVVRSGYQPPRNDPQGYGPAGYGDASGYGPPDTHNPPVYQPQGYQAPPHRAPARRPAVFEEPGYDEQGRTQALPYAPDGYSAPRPGRPRPPGPQPPGARPPGVRPAGPGVAGLRQPGLRTAADGGSASIVRSSGVMAVGTLGSRLTGFIRTLVQASALGSLGIASAYNLANTMPNVVYNLALGGILTSVIVPLIVAAARRGTGRAETYDQRMFTLITFALAGITVVATLAAIPIVDIYSGSGVTGATRHLTEILAFFFIPQIFFYGVSSLIGAILNSRSSFAAPMWTPIVNNVVVIAVLGLYVGVDGQSKNPPIHGSGVALLGIGTTLGIVLQTVALVPALRRVGFRWHPRLDFRRAEVAEIGRMGGWMFGYIAATQVAYLVTTRLAGDTKHGTGITEYNYAWLLFQLPYAVVGISVITALLPRMSAHASQRRFGLVRLDFSAGVRLASAIVVPCSLVLAAIGPKLGEVLFGRHSYGLAAAQETGVVFAIFCLGLLPYMIFQLQLRVFYSVHDSKTPALIGLVTMAVNIVANLIVLTTFRSHLVAGLAAGFGLANVAGVLIAWRILTIRLRGLDGFRIGRSLVRMHAAALPAALVAILVGLLVPNAYAVVIVGGGLAVGMYLLFARWLRLEEVTSLTVTIRARLGR